MTMFATARPRASTIAIVRVSWRRRLMAPAPGVLGRPSRSRQTQRVADPTHRVDQRRIELVDLLAQVADVSLDDVGVTLELVAPDRVQDLELRHDAPRVLE